MANILIALSPRDFDPTEAAIPWKHLREAGHAITFATPDGEPGRADERMLSGEGLAIWKPFLKAREDAVAAYREMEEDGAFTSPLPYEAIDVQRFDGLILPGGHAPGMKPYLESEILQRRVVDFMRAGKPVGAICHGVVVAARSRDPETGRSILYGRKTTALTRSMEMSAWAMTCLWLGDYYRTYPETVQGEVTEALERPQDFIEGPFALLRDTPERLDRGFVVRDGNFLSARWPGDAYRFATTYAKMIEAAEEPPERTSSAA